ncbi:MAG: cysteine--tRNA ligase [Omnitrophica WOR_2 bacterium RBG_13_41_10]|nr:MAG: cysteine--tRNA ligase [Omnitrophica WOR_2 bacterium RBG_13_41_10]
MPIHIYNSLTRKKEEFTPASTFKANIYTCGVTVYDDCHIGHARSLYIFEVIRRYLKYRHFKVNFVRNITDIDDKIINRAKELNLDWRSLVEKYIAGYYEDLAALEIDKADSEPRATENIADMVSYITKLIEKGYAYTTNTGVYFNVRKFKDYGKLSGQSIDEMLNGARKEPDETKQDPLDFALWKVSRPDEPYWESPWGKGRPGWHIECSVMSQKFLKTDTLDIHAGGRDLIFPHHENEIAQGEALTGKPFARYWIHHGLLTINGQKMSKSLGNFLTIKDFISKYHDADILKLLFLSAHYSHPIDYNETRIEEYKKQKKNFDNVFDSINNWIENKNRPVTLENNKIKVDNIVAKFEAAMDEDFNTPLALASLFELADLVSSFISSDKKEAFGYAKAKLESLFEIFGLKPKPKKTLPSDILKMVAEREGARKNKDFQKSDAIREEIKTKFKYLTMDTGSSVTFTEIE